MGRRVESSHRNNDAHVLVAERNDRLAGFAIVHIVQRGRGSLRRSRFKRLASRLMPRADPEPESLVMPVHLGLVQDLYVVPSQRRQGVAAALLEGCEHWLFYRGVGEIQVSVNLHDQAGHSFFESQRFEPLRFLIERKL
jgi:GNAT superfamily N-acetyltransferase